MLAQGFLEEKNLNYFVMPKYDIDLEKLFYSYKKWFKLETIITLGFQILERLEAMHNCGLLHGDLKPQNIMACYNSNEIILIDFGLSYNILKPNSRQYSFKGTPYYASSNQLVKGKIGYKDDIESMMYIMIYFILGKLPW